MSYEHALEWQPLGPSDSKSDVVQGQFLAFGGWAADLEEGRGPEAVVGIVDGVYRLDGEWVPRPDLARLAGNKNVTRCGFAFMFSTALLPVGDHTFALEIYDAKVGVQKSDPIAFRVLARSARPPKPARIVVAAAPKSGSTYTHLVLREYFRIADPLTREFAWNSEHNLDKSMREQLVGQPYILQMHMRAHSANLAAVWSDQISVMVTWRNIADTLISLDDHLAKEAVGSTFLYYMDESAYRALGEQERYQFLIRYAAPWYVNFYLGWKKARAPFFHFESLVADPHAHFSRIIETLAGSVNRRQLDPILKPGKTFDRTDRRNVGRNGRSAEMFSDVTKAMLEDLLQGHFVPLDELIAELPWNG